MTEDHQQLQEHVAAYALNSLEEPERARMEAHVGTCERCTSRLDEYRAVLGSLPIGLEPSEPPAEAWTAIHAAARRRRPARGRMERIIPTTWRWATWPLAVGLAAGMLAWNVWLLREISVRPPGPDVEALARRPGRLVILTGTGVRGASARLLIAVDGRHGHLAIAGLRPLPPGRTYQLWFVPASATPVTGGTFVVDAGGRAWVSITVPISLDDAHVIAITEEPSSGSSAPTSDYLVEAHTWR